MPLSTDGMDEEVAKKVREHNKAKEYATVYCQPFFYGAITRLPFIYFVIHMRFAFGLDWTLVGIFVGCYQATRVVTSIASIFTPGYSHVIGTAVGLAGNILVIASNKDNQANVILGTVLVGSSETLAAMQTYVKRQFGDALNQLEFKLKVQYAAVMVGVTFAFSFGGFIYDQFGINGVATFGAIMSTCELLSIGWYRWLEMNDPSPELEEFEDLTGSNHFEMQLARTSSFASLGDDSEVREDPIKEAINDFSASGRGANYLTYALCFTFGMEAITIGYNLAVSPVYITEVFEMSTTVIGGLLAAGAAFGTITTMAIALPKAGRRFMEKWLPSPLHFLVAMTGISVAVFVAAVPVFPVHVIGLLMLMGFNDLAALLLNELQGSITSTKAYNTMGPMGQVVRRTGNVLTAITGPIFFGIFAQLPYIVAGSITACWTIILTLIIRHRSKANRALLEKSHVDKSVSEFFETTTFSRKEIIARQVESGVFSAVFASESRNQLNDVIEKGESMVLSNSGSEIGLGYDSSDDDDDEEDALAVFKPSNKKREKEEPAKQEATEEALPDSKKQENEVPPTHQESDEDDEIVVVFEPEAAPLMPAFSWSEPKNASEWAAMTEIEC